MGGATPATAHPAFSTQGVELEAGYRLLLVHLYESLNGMRPPTSRVYLSQGQIWAE